MYFKIFLLFFIAGGKGGIHAFPAFAVKFNDIVDPPNILDIHADPRVVYLSGISDLQLRGDILGASMAAIREA